MTQKPLLIMDQHFRLLEELFRPETYAALNQLCHIEGGRNWPMEKEQVDQLIGQATFYISAFPSLTRAQVQRAKHLRAVIEVAGAFNEGLAYEACFDQGIEVLSSAPGFRQSVAEMTLAMILAGGRGLVREHEAFRNASERWLDDCSATDFTLFGEKVGFLGYGQIARETHRLMAPFRPQVMAYDPFLTETDSEVTLCDLNTLVEQCRVIVVAAVPSEETQNLLNAELIARLQHGAQVVLISRAWCTDFDALVDAASAGRILLATDVFPKEPLTQADPLRHNRNVILSPHRAAAVPGGRWLIGDMILNDVRAILNQDPQRLLKPATATLVGSQVAAQKGIQAQ